MSPYDGSRLDPVRPRPRPNHDLSSWSMRMRKSLVIVAATLGCSLEPVATTELPLVPNNPLISLLRASQVRT